MSQLLTLIWLKWRLLRNSLRSSKAVVNKIASALGMLVALAFSLVVALVLGLVAYFVSQPEGLAQILSGSPREISTAATAEFIFFSIFGFMYLMWATLPLSLGGSKQFDAGKLLLYPITLRKLFAVDFVSEFTTLHSVIAVPATLAIAIGAGLATGNLTATLAAAVPIVLFGVALSKWLGTVMGSLLRRKRARGETVVALIGAIAGLGGALAGQIAPILFRHAESIRSLRWTPPGAAASLLVASSNADNVAYGLSFATLSAYAIALISLTYLIARRAALGFEGRRKRKAEVERRAALPQYAGWKLPLMPPDLSAVVEKELRYAMRNAQMRMLAIMPLILIAIRLVNSQRMQSGLPRGPRAASEFMTYGAGLLATGGVLYVFLILAGISCNAFAFEEGGIRTLILSPIDRRKILLGKNIAITLLAVIFATILLTLNTIVFRDLTPQTLLFVVLSFIAFASIMATIGNWLSIRFPKRMVFGKRMNVSGVAGLLLIPIVIVLGIAPVAATLAGYFTRSLLIEYVALALLALVSIGIYSLVLNLHGRTLARREIEILEAVREPTDQ
jgi:ABC-type transport system involved in multi-copper enzyme maturation permease subunit